MIVLHVRIVIVIVAQFCCLVEVLVLRVPAFIAGIAASTLHRNPRADFIALVARRLERVRRRAGQDAGALRGSIELVKRIVLRHFQPFGSM